MLKLNLHLKIFVTCLLTVASGLYEGDQCLKNNVAGVCLNARRCQSALEEIRKKKIPQICGFDGPDPIVCCLDGSRPPAPGPPSTRPISPPSRPPPPPRPVNPQPTTTTTEYIPPEEVFVTVGQEEECEGSGAPNKTGRKALDKCIQYYEELVNPCEKTVALVAGDGRGRVSKCHHSADELIVGGQQASLGEFPHMALLGFGPDSNTASWLCGGSLISEKYILTAGHCTYNRDLGDVTYAVLGLYNRDDPKTGKVYKISQIKKHDQYKPPNKYNDIALLELETEARLSEYVVPACLPLGDEKNDNKALASGWGALVNRGSTSETLQKVTLEKFTTDECYDHFGPGFRLEEGFDSNTQLCYGDKEVRKDTCQGDSGGPLQVKSRRVTCMYVVVGVTSFGKACGVVGQPGVYTRVANYVPWIESVVWPDRG